MLNDIGKFVGRYFQALACLSIVSIAITAIFFDSAHVDFSVILLFWLAAYLIQHNATARKWAIGVCGLVLAADVVLVVYTAIAGAREITIIVLGMRIEHPSPWQVVGIACVSAVLAGLPFALLLTPQARREFQRPARV